MAIASCGFRSFLSHMLSSIALVWLLLLQADAQGFSYFYIEHSPSDAPDAHVEIDAEGSSLPELNMSPAPSLARHVGSEAEFEEEPLLQERLRSGDRSLLSARATYNPRVGLPSLTQDDNLDDVLVKKGGGGGGKKPSPAPPPPPDPWAGLPSGCRNKLDYCKCFVGSPEYKIKEDGCAVAEELFAGRCYRKCITFGDGEFPKRVAPNGCAATKCQFSEDLFGDKCYKACRLLNTKHPVRKSANQCGSIKNDQYSVGYGKDNKPIDLIMIAGHLSKPMPYACTGFNVNCDYVEEAQGAVDHWPCPYQPAKGWQLTQHRRRTAGKNGRRRRRTTVTASSPGAIAWSKKHPPTWWVFKKVKKEGKTQINPDENTKSALADDETTPKPNNGAAPKWQ